MNPGDSDLIEEVSDHIERHVGPIAMVFHEIISDDLHIDVHHVLPAPGRPYHALITSGMSERAMNTPPEVANWQFAELSILLDPTWDLRNEKFGDENVYWPIRLLKMLARYPFEHDTWLGMGHTLGGYDPPRGFAPATQLSATVLLPPLTLGPDFFSLSRSDGRAITFWSVVPLYAEELALKLDKDADSLMDAMDAAGVTDIVSPTRHNVTKRKRLFGLF